MIGDKLDKRPYSVLCIDGGGMRGIYSATYLKALASAYSRKRGIAGIDLGASFDLIAGTMSWSQIVGQFGSEVKVYSAV